MRRLTRLRARLPPRSHSLVEGLGVNSGPRVFGCWRSVSVTRSADHGSRTRAGSRARIRCVSTAGAPGHATQVNY